MKSSDGMVRVQNDDSAGMTVAHLLHKRRGMRHTVRKQLINEDSVDSIRREPPVNVAYYVRSSRTEGRLFLGIVVTVMHVTQN
jgi:hypothetical protein